MSPTKAKTEPVGMGAPTGGAIGPNSAPSQEMRATQEVAVDPVIERLERWRQNAIQHAVSEKEWLCTELVTVFGEYGMGKATLSICVSPSLRQRAILKVTGNNPINAIFIKKLDELSAFLNLLKRIEAKKDVLEKIVQWAEGTNGKTVQRVRNEIGIEL